MSSVITTIGWLGFAGALIFFMIEDRSNPANLHFIGTTQHVLVASGALVLCGYFLKYLGHILGFGQGRCRNCGKRIDRQEMYCFDHRLETIRRAQEKGRIPGPKKR